MMTLSQEEKGLPQKISDDIIALILEENLKPGDKLPNETILSQRLDVGRSSLREAMKLLASPKHCHCPPGIRNLYRRVSWYGRRSPWIYFH